MQKRKEIKKILIRGAGPIIIGQVCECVYSGTQACKALKDEGYKVILINSNPATIMTDPEVADKTYIEPITLEVLEEVIKKDKPDAILPTMGGQTALNLAINAEKNGLLKSKSFLVTGKLNGISRAEVKSLIEENSGNTVSSVSNKLDYLITGEKPTKRKIDSAKKLKIKIISQYEFLKMLNKTG